jgi:transposase
MGDREMLDAMLYQLKNGCNWTDFPKDYQTYSTGYWHYKQWRVGGLIDKSLNELYE